jgi:hypothetical protein
LPIPLTRVRLKGFGVKLEVSASNAPILADQPVDFSNLVTIGSARKLVVDQRRNTNNVRREFSENGPGSEGKPIESYPGLANFEVTLDRVDLYDATIMEAFTFSGINIVKQFKPMILQCTQLAPVDPITGAAIRIPGSPRDLLTRSYAIIGCWINGFTTEFDQEAEDQKFVQSITMIATDVFVPTA